MYAKEKEDRKALRSTEEQFIAAAAHGSSCAGFSDAGLKV
jgi:hypothetical protein